jgi:hypothetical protein
MLDMPTNRPALRHATQVRLDFAQARYLQIRAELEDSSTSVLIRQLVGAAMVADIKGRHLPEAEIQELLALVSVDEEAAIAAAGDARAIVSEDELRAENERRQEHDDVPVRAEDLRR